MLTHPVLLSTAAEIVGGALGLDVQYVTGQARRFVRDGLLKPAQTVGGGVNRRAFLDSFGVARLAVASIIQKHGTHLGDQAAAVRQLDSVFDSREPGNHRFNFDSIVREFAQVEVDKNGDLPSDSPEWFFHWHVRFNGEYAGQCSREPVANEVSHSIAIVSTRVALRPVILAVLDAMNVHEAQNS